MANAGVVNVRARNAGVQGRYSQVTSRPSSGSPWAIQMVLKPASVPISRTRRAPESWTSNFRSLPALGATSMGGMPASRAVVTARLSALSGRTTASERKFSTATQPGVD